MQLHAHPNALERRTRPRASADESQAHAAASTIMRTYSEMPGLVLRFEQVVRRFALSPATCEAALDALVQARRLRRTHDGQYALA